MVPVFHGRTCGDLIVIVGSTRTIEYNSGDSSPIMADEKLFHQLQEQVDHGLKCRREQRIKAVFENYCEVGHESISRSNLGAALAKLNFVVESQRRLYQIFEEMDMNRDETLDFTEFRRILNKKSAIQEWAATLQLDMILADAIPDDGGSFGLRTIPATTILNYKVEQRISVLSNEELDVICAVVSNGLRKLLSDKVAEYKACFSENAITPQDLSNSNSGKYQAVMNCGSIDNFHKGLEDRVGKHIMFRASQTKIDQIFIFAKAILIPSSDLQ